MRELFQKWLGSISTRPIPNNLHLPNPGMISTDSRTIQAGQWFLPLSGERHDGHMFVEETVNRTGAGFFFEEKKQGMIPPQLQKHGIAVTSTLAALQAIARGWRQQQKSLTVVALTGSVGKTTTREFARALFSAQGQTHGTEGNFNNEIGLPLSLLRIKETDRFSILELGTRHIGDLSFLCNICEPDVVACLNVGSAHLGEFGGPENLFAAKMEIFAASKATSIAVSPAWDQRIQDFVTGLNRRNITFGIASGATVRVAESRWLPQGGMEIDLDISGERTIFRIGLGHQAYPMNVAAAAAMAVAAGLPVSKLGNALESFVGLKGRYRLQQIKGVTVVDDSYNASPQSMRAGFDSLASGFPAGKKVLILGDMLELGSASDDEHWGVGSYAAKLNGLALLVTVGESGKIIGKAAIAAGLMPSRVVAFEDVEELIASRSTITSAGDVLYVKASNGVGLRKFIDTLG